MSHPHCLSLYYYLNCLQFYFQFTYKQLLFNTIMLSAPATPPDDDPKLVERVCLVRFAYHLWRVDSAARAFPRELETFEEIHMMKNRWEIGLVLELVK